MDTFIRSQNVALYRRLLESVSEEPKRHTILTLLAEEQKNQRNAGDALQ
jgi:hypothetical protein